MTPPEEGQRQLLKVVGGGEPTEDELAALVAAVVTAVTAVTVRSQPPRSRWNDRRAQLRKALHPGPGAWRAAGRR